MGRLNVTTREVADFQCAVSGDRIEFRPNSPKARSVLGAAPFTVPSDQARGWGEKLSAEGFTLSDAPRDQ